MYCRLDYKLVGALEKIIENFKKTKLIIKQKKISSPKVNPPLLLVN